jgi:hypothetical protein
MERTDGEHGSYMVNSDVLSRGGVGSIHRTDDPRWVFKRYLRPEKAPDLGHLQQLVEIGREVLVRQRAEPGETPESSVNWPVDVALGRSGLITGVVLPAIPPALFSEFGKPRGLEFLVMARAHPPLAKGRVALLLRMAEILAFVNSQGLVHGDVNGKNLAWGVLPSPVMYLIDCDGMVPQHPPPTAGVQALGWTDPRVLDGVVPAHDHYSDWYALGLALYRGLLLTPGKLDSKANGRWPAPSQIPDSLSHRIAHLLHRALDDPLDPHGRPSPGEWASALVEEYLDKGSFRDGPLASLDRISAPRISAPRQAFTPLPDDDWTSTHPKLQTPPPRAPRAPSPAQQPAASQQRISSPTRYRFPPAPPAAPPPRPTRMPAPPPPNSAKIGRLAQRALDGSPEWWRRTGLFTSFLVPGIAIPYIVISLIQLRKVNRSDPRLRPARTALLRYGAIAAFPYVLIAVIMLIALVGAVK